MHRYLRSLTSRLPEIGPRVQLAAAGVLSVTAITLISSGVFGHPSGVTPRGKISEIGVASTEDWFYWDFHPSIVIGIVILMVLYGLGITVWRRRFELGEPAPRWKVVTFYANMVLL